MAPRENNILLNWLGATGFNGSSQPPASSGQQQLFHSTMLPLWLATVLAREDICMAILCGAPCSGKSEATRKMVAIFGDVLTVMSDDLACDAKAPSKKGLTMTKAHTQDEFDVVVRSLQDKPRVVICDDANTQFQDYAAKLASALASGIKVQNLAWFVFDKGLAEADEVEYLVTLQQKRLKDFWQSSEDGAVAHASDGKITSPDAVWRAVRQIRTQYFHNMELRVYNTEWIINQLLEFVQVQRNRTPPVSPPLFPHTTSSSTSLSPSPPSPASPNPLTTFSSAVLALLPSATMPALPTSMASIPNPLAQMAMGPIALQLPTTLDATMTPRTTSMAPLPTPMASLPNPMAPLPTALANHSATLGTPAMHSNAMPIIGLPADQNSNLGGDQQFWDQQHAPMYFVLTDGHNGSQLTPLQLPLHFPSSAASPPFTVTNPVTSTGDHTTGLDFNCDDSSLAYALALAHQPGKLLGSHDDFMGHTPPQPSSPLSPSPAFQMMEMLNGSGAGKKLNKLDRKGRKKEGNGVVNGNGIVNGSGNGSAYLCNGHLGSVGNGAGNGNTNGNGKGCLKHSKLQKSYYSDTLKTNGKTGKKKLQNGWGGPPSAAPAMGSKGELTLRSVLNDYWKTHKTEIDAHNDFDIKVPAGLMKNGRFEEETPTNGHTNGAADGTPKNGSAKNGVAKATQNGVTNHHATAAKDVAVESAAECAIAQ